MTFVLTVDDDPAILRTLGINLRARGYDVEIATDGRSALQIVHERMPDVILLDLGLPDLDGIAVLRQVRSFSQVPVIAVSSASARADTTMTGTWLNERT
jgi:two-component system KDP operon response regulator KdpE